MLFTFRSERNPTMKRGLLSLSGLLLLGCAAPGASRPQQVALVSDFRYDYIDALYVETDVPGSSENADGYLFEGSFGITEDLRLLIGQRNVDQTTGGIDIEETKFGAGFHREVSENADLVIDLFLLDGKGDNGSGASGGVRAWLSDRIEVGATLEYLDIYGDDDLGLGLNAVWYASQELGLVGRFVDVGDQTTIGFGVRATL